MKNNKNNKITKKITEIKKNEAKGEEAEGRRDKATPVM